MTNKTILGLAACVLASAIMCGCEEQQTAKRTREYDAMILQPTSRKLSSIYSASIRGKQDIDIRPKVSG